jgi:cytoplasmic iron level regulating protein YaaA (DUF328/UPF0246 family)
VQGRVQSARKLREFSAEGYALDPESSSAERLVFRRRQDEPA